MRTALLVGRVELRRRMRDRTGLVMALGAPLLLMSVLGLAFASGDDSRIRILVADDVHTERSAALSRAMLSTPALGREVVVRSVPSRAVATREVDSGGASAAIVLSSPAYFDVDESDVPGGVLVWVYGPSRGRPIGPVAAESIHQAALAQVDILNVLADNLRTAGLPAADVPVVIRDDAATGEANLISHFGPAMGVTFLFLTVGLGARALLTERQRGTFVRLVAAPVRPVAVLAGKMGAQLALSFASMLVLWAASTHLFDATWGPPGLVLLLTVVTVLAIGALGALVAALARTESSAQAAIALLAFVLALLGGSFFPPGSVPGALRLLHLVTPNGWALEAYGRLGIDGEGLGAIVPSLLVLSVIALVAGSLAVARLRRVMSL
jgi:ABC-2 type transport system permease protein